MDLSLALPLAMGATALTGTGLAAFLVWRARQAAGAIPLALFLLLDAVWALGVLTPGPLGQAAMALAPLGAALFLHFCLRLAGRGGGLLPWSYAVAVTASLLAEIGGSGHFDRWEGVWLFRYDGVGLLAGGVTLTLAGLGFALLVEAWRWADGVARPRIAVILAGCGLGLASVTGLALPTLGLPPLPWLLVLLPLYLALLAYGALRYDLAAGLHAQALQAAQRQHLAELGALAATIAHDLRNPMAIIAMAAADTAPATRAEIRNQLTRMDALVRDLLDYAKPWAVTPEPILLAPLFTQDHRPITLEMPAGMTVRADPLRLWQALDNLLTNAADAERILVVAEPGDKSVQIHVCDNGPGIPDDIRPTLFQPFVSRTPGGTGLGLAIVAKVMRAHGGSVRLSQRPGWTTCISLSFPA